MGKDHAERKFHVESRESLLKGQTPKFHCDFIEKEIESSESSAFNDI